LDQVIKIGQTIEPTTVQGSIVQLSSNHGQIDDTLK